MTKEEVYEIWAPAGAIWSPWVKPVLFAHLDSVPIADSNRSAPLDISWAPNAQDGTALILDLPGAEGIVLATALSTRGFRSVPLYNALPAPAGCSDTKGSTERTSFSKPVALVDVQPIVVALREGAEVLQRLQLAPNAPPAFLLDARRRAKGVKPHVGDFDNRYVSFPADFPSGKFLTTNSIRAVILVQWHDVQPQPDLVRLLLQWQEAGIEILSKAIDSHAAPMSIVVTPPSRFRSLLDWFWERFILQRNPLGGFGGFISESGSG